MAECDFTCSPQAHQHCSPECERHCTGCASRVSDDTEGDAWDELWDTDAARCCSCPSCNYYAPDYEQNRDEPCILRTLIERIVAARLEPIEALADRFDGYGHGVYCTHLEEQLPLLRLRIARRPPRPTRRGHPMTADPFTWPENARPTAEQLADWLSTISRGARIAFAEQALRGQEAGERCFIQNHAAASTELATLRAGLAEAIAYAERHDGRTPVGQLRALL